VASKVDFIIIYPGINHKRLYLLKMSSINETEERYPVQRVASGNVKVTAATVTDLAMVTGGQVYVK